MTGDGGAVALHQEPPAPARVPEADLLLQDDLQDPFEDGRQAREATAGEPRGDPAESSVGREPGGAVVFQAEPRTQAAGDAGRAVALEGDVQGVHLVPDLRDDRTVRHLQRQCGARVLVLQARIAASHGQHRQGAAEVVGPSDRQDGLDPRHAPDYASRPQCTSRADVDTAARRAQLSR